MSNANINKNKKEQKAIPIGISDFKEIIEGNYCYVDKSLCIKELLDNRAKVTLLPRPRRFGKTLTLSMLRYFFEKSSESHAPLFEKLAIAQHPEIMKQQGQCPVIFFTFKEAKQADWENCYAKLSEVISNLFIEHNYLLELSTLTEKERAHFIALSEQNASYEVVTSSLKNLSFYLEQYHGAKPVVLIDEYDAPIHSGYGNGYYEKIIDFIRSFLGAGLKDNNALNFAVMTGILRVAKESIFSGLNHLAVYTILDDPFAKTFGFTQPEVDRLLQEYDLVDQAEEVRSWYNGYTIGTLHGVYNPWSLLNFLMLRKIGTYWLNTSDNQLIHQVLSASSASFKADLENLMAEKSIEKEIDALVNFQRLDHYVEAVWSLLLFSGYLTVISQRREDTDFYYELKIPNKEVFSFYKKTVLGWFSQRSDPDYYLSMLRALTAGELERFKDYFEMIVIHSLSSFDLRGDEQENFYHALVLGMLVSLSESHEVISNRESGFGRYDIMIIPKNISGGKPGIIIEFKRVNGRLKESLEQAVVSALKQIEEKQYQAQLEARGIKNIIKLGIAFEGKQCLVREAGEAPAA